MDLVFVLSGNLNFSFDSIVELDLQNTIQSNFDNFITWSIIIFSKNGSTVRYGVRRTVRCVQNSRATYLAP